MIVTCMACGELFEGPIATWQQITSTGLIYYPHKPGPGYTRKLHDCRKVSV